MSFILNALRKSDQERQAKQVEVSGHKLLVKQEDSENKNNFPWLIILASINICLLAYFIWSTAQEEGSRPSEIEKTVVVEKNKPSMPNKKKAFIQPLTDLTKEHQKTSIAQRIKEQKETVQPEVEHKIYVDKKIQRISDVEIKNTEPLRILSKQSTANNSSDIPFLSELSYEFRRTVPSININVFVYSRNEEDRFIMVNMKRYLSGQDIEEGVTLKEIRKNSIVVKYKNRIFKIKR